MHVHVPRLERAKLISDLLLTFERKCLQHSDGMQDDHRPSEMPPSEVIPASHAGESASVCEPKGSAAREGQSISGYDLTLMNIYEQIRMNQHGLRVS